MMELTAFNIHMRDNSISEDCAWIGNCVSIIQTDLQFLGMQAVSVY